MLLFSKYWNTFPIVSLKRAARVLGMFKSNRRRWFLHVGSDMTYVQAAMFPEDGVWRKHRIIPGYMQKEHASSSAFDRAEVILELYNIGQERHARQTAALLHAENFERTGVQKMLKDVSACNHFMCDTRNESFMKNGFRKLPGFIECATAMKISNANNSSVLVVHENRIEVCASTIYLQFCKQPKEHFRHSMETA